MASKTSVKCTYCAFRGMSDRYSRFQTPWCSHAFVSVRLCLTLVSRCPTVLSHYLCAPSRNNSHWWLACNWSDALSHSLGRQFCSRFCQTCRSDNRHWLGESSRLPYRMLWSFSYRFRSDGRFLSNFLCWTALYNSADGYKCKSWSHLSWPKSYHYLKQLCA